MNTLLERLRGRRLFQIVAAYAAAGWIALEVADQLVDRGVLPELVYQVILVLVVAGFPAALILGWFHGRKGQQRVTPLEVTLLSLVALGGLSASAVVVGHHLSATEPDLGELAEAGLSPNRLAVLYFDYDGPDSLSYLADGFTEELIGRLSEVPALDVVSSNGVAPFRTAGIGRDSIARALGAGTLIGGRVQTRDDRIEITTELVDGASGSVFQRQSFDLPADELLAIRGELADRATRLLRTWLGEEVRLRERRAAARNVAAWSLVQRAERARKQAEALADHGEAGLARAELERADSLLGLAERADTAWAEPSVLRAQIAFERANIAAYAADDLDGALRDIESGIRHADRALALAENRGPALEQRGKLRYLHWFLDVEPDPDERARLLQQARSDLESAVRIDPGLAGAHAMLSHLYYQIKDNVSVILAARNAYEADAYLANADAILFRLFWASYDLGQFNEARRWCEEGARRFSEDYRFVECQLWLMLPRGSTADPDRAWQLVGRLETVTPESRRPFERRLGRMIAGGVLGRAGLADSARAVLVDARGDLEVDPGQELYGYEAIMRTLLGDHDTAVALLKRYVAANPHHSFTVEDDFHWWWRPLRDHAGFREVTAPQH